MADSPLDVLARTTGALLATGTRALGATWHRVKPLHPEGALRRATITRLGGPIRSGVPWIDDDGEDEALVRVSRALGLPESLPDIHGLAIRVEPAGRPADLLLASTGLGRVTRFVLTAAKRPSGRPLTSLLPYRSPRGPLLVAAAPDSPRTFDLLLAGPVTTAAKSRPPGPGGLLPWTPTSLRSCVGTAPSATWLPATCCSPTGTRRMT